MSELITESSIDSCYKDGNRIFYVPIHKLQVVFKLQYDRLEIIQTLIILIQKNLKLRSLEETEDELNFLLNILFYEDITVESDNISDNKSVKLKTYKLKKPSS